MISKGQENFKTSDKRRIIPPCMRVPNARYQFRILLQWYLGRNVIWMDGYDKIADWLADSHYKGLLLYGGCGVGKTIIATKIIPYIVEKGSEVDYVMPVFKARDLAESAKIPDIINARFKAIDDIGQEVAVTYYGTKKFAFCDILDEAEEKAQFLVVTTNLTANDLKMRYGERAFDRLRQICTPIRIEGQSQRGQEQSFNFEELCSR